MSNIYENYQILKRNAYRSYWEKRILAEVGYLLELHCEEDISAKKLMEEAISLLMNDYYSYKQINGQTAQEAEEILDPLSEKAKNITVVCAAHAHIDMNWIWGYQETVAITLDTVRTMLKLMKEYPDFVFSQSQASIYYILEEYAPELLAQVKERIKEGRWEVTASTWVENDKNMPNGESLARHLLYTKKYLSKLLDIKEDTLNFEFEPDTFGHSYNLPEILQKGGVSRYYHCRGFDKENIYRWRGMSGAEILVYRDRGMYGTTIDVNIIEGVPTFCSKYGINKVLTVYGVGDHGGGPTRRDIERLIDMNSWPLYPAISFGTYKEYFDYLEEHKEQFPIVDQELNYIFTGCYTSQARIKLANRMGEARLTEAETLESMAKLDNPEFQKGKNMEDAWRTILFNHFHDILPGSGNVDTREHALGKFQEAMARAGANGVRAMDALCEHIADENTEKEDYNKEDLALGAGVGKGTDRTGGFGFTTAGVAGGAVRYLTLFNTTQEVRTEPTEITLWDWQQDIGNIRICDVEGKEYPFCHLGREGMFGWGANYWGHICDKFLVWVPVPAVGYTVLRIDTKESTAFPIPMNWDSRTDHITDEPIYLENDKIKAVFESSTMKCTSLIRKADGKEMVIPHKPACGMVLITEETSNGMTSWRVGKTSSIVDLNEICDVKPTKIQTGGMRKELEYSMEREGLDIRVKIRLDDGSEFLDYQLDVIWKLFGTQAKGLPQLRFMVPCGYNVDKYRYIIPYGVIDRPPLAQDVPALGVGCALDPEGGSSLGVLSDCKYGFRGDKEGLSLNLIRSFYQTDGYPEIGEHTIRILVGPCDPAKESLAMLGEKLSHPVISRSCASKPKLSEASKGFLSVEGGILSAFKEAEDGNGFIVRVYNPVSEERTMKLSLPDRKVEAYLCDIIENNLKPLAAKEDEVVEYVLGGNEVCSIRLIDKTKERI